jgi:predicted RNase H-like HicB family nuclease
MRVTVELDRASDGRWIADVAELPGVLAYGSTREEALAAARALALRVLAERLERGEAPAEIFEGERLVIRLEPAAVADEVLPAEAQAELWRAWAENGPQGPIEDEAEPEFP